MSRNKNGTEFVSIVAREICSGIDRALTYWLGRIESEAGDDTLTSAQRISAIQAILQEYRQNNGSKLECAAV